MNNRSNQMTAVLAVLLASSADDLSDECRERTILDHDILLTGDHPLVVFTYCSDLPESSPVIATDGSISSSAGVDYIEAAESDSFGDLVLYEGRIFPGEAIHAIDLLSASQAMDTIGCGVIDPVQPNEYPFPKSERGRPKHAFRTKPPVRRTGMRRK